MKKNMGTADRLIRIILAIVVIVLYTTKQLTGTAAIILGAFALIFLLTSFVAFCPLYVPFRLSTRKRE
jgi:uncharacterized membrane protein YesL